MTTSPRTRWMAGGAHLGPPAAFGARSGSLSSSQGDAGEFRCWRSCDRSGARLLKQGCALAQPEAEIPRGPPATRFGHRAPIAQSLAEAGWIGVRKRCSGPRTRSAPRSAEGFYHRPGQRTSGRCCAPASNRARLPSSTTCQPRCCGGNIGLCRDRLQAPHARAAGTAIAAAMDLLPPPRPGAVRPGSRSRLRPALGAASLRAARPQRRRRPRRIGESRQGGTPWEWTGRHRPSSLPESALRLLQSCSATPSSLSFLCPLQSRSLLAGFKPCGRLRLS